MRLSGSVSSAAWLSAVLCSAAQAVVHFMQPSQSSRLICILRILNPSSLMDRAAVFKKRACPDMGQTPSFATIRSVILSL